MASPRPAPAPSRSIRPAPPPDGKAKDMVGDFERRHEIGKGSFATVYLARHRKTRTLAAIKVVAMNRIKDKLRTNLDQEIAIMKTLNHPHVVGLFVVEKTPMYLYIVMEHCKLTDLSHFTKKRDDMLKYPEVTDIFRKYPNAEPGGLNEVLCRHFFKQLASALDYLRLNGFVHRDIKPQNLLLTPPPVDLHSGKWGDLPMTASKDSLDPTVGVMSLPMLKLADFGFARPLLPNQMAETLCGSPLYMAPEILRYERYDNKSDLWSAGVVLYELLTGRAPFRASNHVELLRKIEQAEDVIPFDKRVKVSRDIKVLLRGLLKKNPLDRISYDDLANDAVVTGDIPGLLDEDKPLLRFRNKPVAETGSAIEARDDQAEPSAESPQQKDNIIMQDEIAGPSRKSSETGSGRQPEAMTSRTSSRGSQDKEGVATEMQRRPSQREPPKQRRPSIQGYATAPARHELLNGMPPPPSAGPRMERRPSRTSPLAGPPMVREPSAVDLDRSKGDRAKQEARDRTAQDMAFEKEYVMVEKRAVEINAFADELEAKRGPIGAAMTRRATTQGQPLPVIGSEPSSTTRAMQMVSTRPHGAHYRTGSFERRIAPSPQSATNMLTKALNAANNRLFGALGTSPPFGRGSSPPSGYSAFPSYPTPQAALLITEGSDGRTPIDEDTKIIRIMEDAGHRSDVIFGFAEVKFRQLVPATPSAAPDALGIQQIGAQEKPMAGSAEGEDKDMTTIAVVGVAEEALVLYVKTLAILAKTINLAAYWWTKQNRAEQTTSEPSSRAATPAPSNAEVGKRMNNVVQWARARFNECLEKSEVVGRRLQTAQRELPLDHPGHPDNQSSNAASNGSAITTSAEHIHITSGVTAEKLMFDRAVEMSRAAAVAELVGEQLNDCDLSYVTAIMLLEAVLESDDEPLMRKPSAKKDKAADEVINGMETEDRQTVIKLIESARTRLAALRKKLHTAQQSSKRASQSGSGNVTPKPTANPSPAPTPAIAGSPPK